MSKKLTLLEAAVLLVSSTVVFFCKGFLLRSARQARIATTGTGRHNVAPFFCPYMWKVPVTQKPDQCLGEWIDREALAEAMIPLIGQLYRNNNVVSSIYGRSLINQSVIAILKAHRFARPVSYTHLTLPTKRIV